MTYRAWCAIIQRCENDKNPSYPRYGGRGVIVDARWRSEFGFENFLADVGERPSGAENGRALWSLDRFPNRHGNYEPGNVRWATNEMQAQNKGDNVLDVDLVRDIRSLHAGGEARREIANALGLRLCVVYDVISWRSWRNA